MDPPSDPYPPASSSRTPPAAEPMPDNVASGSQPAQYPDHASWRPLAKKPSSLQSRYATSKWASSGQMDDISKAPGVRSDSKKRYKRDEPEDYDDPYTDYRKTSTNMFGRHMYEVSRDVRSILTHPTSDLRTAPPSHYSTASPRTPSTPGGNASSFRSSRDPDSLPRTPERHPHGYRHPASIRTSDEGDEEESLISATKLMQVESARGSGMAPYYDYRKPSARDPPPTKMHITHHGSPPRTELVSGSSRSRSTGNDDEEARPSSSRCLEPDAPRAAAAVAHSPNISLRVTRWVGDVDNHSRQPTLSDDPPVTHITTSTYTVPTYTSRQNIASPGPESRRPAYGQQRSYCSTAKSVPDEEDCPVEEETDELDYTDDGSDADVTASSSKRHLDRLGNGVKNLKNNGIHYCPHCEASFRRNFDMNRHIASIHAERSDLTCPGCPSRSRPFSRRDALRRHLKSVMNQNPTPRRRICNLTPAEASSIMEQLSTSGQLGR